MLKAISDVVICSVGRTCSMEQSRSEDQKCPQQYNITDKALAFSPNTLAVLSPKPTSLSQFPAVLVSFGLDSNQGTRGLKLCSRQRVEVSRGTTSP